MTETVARTAPLAVTDRGTGGPAVLFVPGWCGDRDVFDPLLPGASAHRRAVSVDLPDHGDSPARDGPHDRRRRRRPRRDHRRARHRHRRPGRSLPRRLGGPRAARRLGADRVPGVVLMDWMVLGTPPGFADALGGLQSPAWADVREGLTSMWLDGLDIPALTEYVASMKTLRPAPLEPRRPRDRRRSSPPSRCRWQALEALQPCPTLHLYAQPAADEVLAAQQEYAAAHPWFSVRRLDAAATSRCSRCPRTWSTTIESFVRRSG